jgi:AraC family transcriptional regulator, ethanolamine operon transcriptional activator
VARPILIGSSDSTTFSANSDQMPRQTFSSFEAFFDANRHASLRAMVLGPVRENWSLTHLLLKNLSIQFGQAESKALVEGAPRSGGVSIFMPTRSESAWWGNGRQFDELSLMVALPGDDFCLVADTTRSWCSLYIPNAELVGPSGDVTTAIGSSRAYFQVPPQRMDRFRSTIGRLDEAVQLAPAAFESPIAQKASAQKLVREIRNVLATSHELEPKLGRRAVPRQQIIRRAMDFVDQHDGEYLSLEELAAAAGVSERTLRDAFHWYFGIPPLQYLNRRTLHQVRRALKAADPTVATVTAAATQFGVWQFGRMARDYRLLFGELPSETLRDRH